MVVENVRWYAGVACPPSCCYTLACLQIPVGRFASELCVEELQSLFPKVL